jgi:hypothetical protein
VRRRFIWLYPAWIALCAILFLALRGADDPSRRGDRILNTEAGARAITVLQHRDPLRFRDYEPVHVAWAGRGEGGEVGRWVVLCDRRVHTGLGDAVVVELEGRQGRLLMIRRPEGSRLVNAERRMQN